MNENTAPEGQQLKADKGKARLGLVPMRILWAIARVRESGVAYSGMILDGCAAQTARRVLPLCLATQIVMTANLREWRHVLRIRTARDAHPDMRALMIPLLLDFKNKIPVVFDDILTDAPIVNQLKGGE